MISTADFRNGITILLEDKLMQLVEFQHVKPGKGGAFVRTKLKNVLTGRVLEKTFRAGERMEEAKLIEEQYQFSYSDGDLYHFMHKESFEMLAIGSDVLGDAPSYLKENDTVGIVFHNGRVIAINLPITTELKITHAEPGVQGDRAQGGTKPVTLETGLQIQVPLFVNEGEVVRVDTRTGQYIERA